MAWERTQWIEFTEVWNETHDLTIRRFRREHHARPGRSGVARKKQVPYLREHALALGRKLGIQQYDCFRQDPTPSMHSYRASRTPFQLKTLSSRITLHFFTLATKARRPCKKAFPPSRRYCNINTSHDSPRRHEKSALTSSFRHRRRLFPLEAELCSLRHPFCAK